MTTFLSQSYGIPVMDCDGLMIYKSAKEELGVELYNKGSFI